jgi:hypothetical protein
MIRGAHLYTALEIAGPPPWNGGEGRGDEVLLRVWYSYAKLRAFRRRPRETKVKMNLDSCSFVKFVSRGSVIFSQITPGTR